MFPMAPAGVAQSRFRTWVGMNQNLLQFQENVSLLALCGSLRQKCSQSNLIAIDRRKRAEGGSQELWCLWPPHHAAHHPCPPPQAERGGGSEGLCCHCRGPGVGDGVPHVRRQPAPPSGPLVSGRLPRA
ncbi:hypothetical protein GH733_001262 [Mirounga leonina]|nr:hypothetical protein GH733_001262 [Mirounga leonina]